MDSRSLNEKRKSRRGGRVSLSAASHARCSNGRPRAEAGHAHVPGDAGIDERLLAVRSPAVLAVQPAARVEVEVAEVAERVVLDRRGPIVPEPARPDLDRRGRADPRAQGAPATEERFDLRLIQPGYL